MRAIKNKNILNNITLSLFNSVSVIDNKLEQEKIIRILRDIDISSAINKLNRAVAGRRIKILTDDMNLLELSKELQKRFNGIKFNRIINHLISARYFGYSCFEIIYNKNFEIETLIPIPHENISYTNKKWVLQIGSEEVELTKDKFLLAIHQWNPGKPEGKSILEECNLSFLNKERFENLLRGLSQQYGKVIPVFLYDEDLEEKEIEELAKSIENPNGMKSIGIPVNKKVIKESEVKKVIDFIKLSDLDPEIYTKLEEREKKKLIQNILGGTLTIEASSAEGNGTNALGTVHQEGFYEVVTEICSFVSDSLFQLLEIDAMYHGYDAKDFKIILEEEVTESETINKSKMKEELNASKLENLLKLKNVGYALNKKALSEMLGISEKDLQEYEEKGILEFSSLPSKKKINFLKEKVELNNEIFDKAVENSMDLFTKDISGQLKEKLLKIKKPIDIEKISLDFNLLKEKLILSHLKGIIDDSELNSNEFSDDADPFNLKYEKAIQYFLNKKPTLIDDLEEINNKVLEQVFYIKRSTEIETTKKLYSSLLSNMEEGKTFKNWLGDSEEVLNKSGLLNNPYYLEIVYRNNMNSAYNAGAFYNQELNRENKPYGLYDAVGDNRTSSICKSLDEKVYPLDHVFWKNYLPPNHHYCRSRRVTLSKEEVKDYGFNISKTIPKDIKGLKDKMGNFYGDHLSGLKKLVKTKEKELLKLKASDESGILKEEPKFKSLNECFEKISLKNIDKEFQGEIEDVLLKLQNKYTLNSKYVIKTAKNKTTFGSCRVCVVGTKKKGITYTKPSQELVYNSLFQKNKELSKSFHKATYSIRNSKLISDETGLSTIYHEYAHAMDNSYYFELNKDAYKEMMKWNNVPIVSNEQVKTINAFNKEINSGKDRLSTKLINRLKEERKLDNIGVNKLIQKELGSYASSNSKEFLAEAFANINVLEDNKKNQFIKDIERMIDEEWEKVMKK